MNLPPSLRRLWPVGLGLLALVPGLFSEKGDTVLYAIYAGEAFAGRHFFTQIPIEYPPLNALLFLLPEALAHLAPGLGYYGSFLLMAAGADLLQRRALLCATALPSRAVTAGLGAACAALLFYTYLKRFDVFAAAATTWMLTRLLRNPKDLGAWVLGALAVSCKLYPATFAPLCLIYSHFQGTPARRLAQQVATGATVLLAIHGVATLYGGAAAWTWVAYMQMRGLQLASVYTALGMLFEGLGRPLPIAYGYGCLQVYTPWAAWCVRASPWLTLGMLSLTWRLTWRRANTAHGLWCGAAACVVALLLTSKVLSPQYVIWLVPLLSIAAAGPPADRRLIILTLVLCASTALLFPYEVEIGQGQLFRQGALLVRSGVLMAIWATLCRSRKASAP